MRLDPPPGEQMSTLLQTDEALASQIAPFRLDRLEELATQLDAEFVSPPRKWPILETGNVWEGESLQPALGEGWTETSAEEFCSSGASAQLGFGLLAEARRDGAAVKVELRAQYSPATGPRTVALSVNEIAYAEILVDTDEQFLIDIPLEDLTGDEIVMTLATRSGDLDVSLYAVSLTD